MDFIAQGDDCTSGMDRVEFFIENESQEIINGSGPDYNFLVEWTEAMEFYRITLQFYHYDRAGHEVLCTLYISGQFPPGSPPAIPRYVGLILNPKITEENISFFAIMILSTKPYSSKLIILNPVTVEYDYEGYIGKYFIRIFLNDWYP
jgi:hypothetical protein